MADQTAPGAGQEREPAGDATALLWAQLAERRLGGWRFERRPPVPPWVAEFACEEAALVIGLDAGAEGTDAGDLSRDRELAARGWRVLRFARAEVEGNLAGVLAALAAMLGRREAR
ncbi:DUF559 domain-containing protein [Geminicoccaceae bacterium 1502E]|nr:DUF559 domain-containing protein [Geminicoccaceae bacterium 1502E]